jgi:hypothetical protein
VTDIAALIRILDAKGLSAKDIADVVDAVSGPVPAYGMEMTTRLAADLKRREYDRARHAEKRAAEKAAKEAALLGNPRTSTDSRDISGHPPETTPAKDAPAPTYTRGENNLSRLVDIPNQTTLNASEPEPDLDWPDGDKPGRAYLDRLEAALRAAAGPALNPTSTRLFSLAPILSLGRNGAGPPCDVQADVIPTIRARSTRAPPGSVKSWDFFTEAIREARDRRLTGAPAVEALNRGSRNDRPDKLSAKLENMASAQRGFALASARRAL